MNNGTLLSRYYALASRLAGSLYAYGESIDDVVSLARANKAAAIRSSGENRSQNKMLAGILLGLVSHVLMTSSSTTQGEMNPNTHETTKIGLTANMKPESHVCGSSTMPIQIRGFADVINKLENIANVRDADAEATFGNNISKTIGASNTELHVIDNFLMASDNASYTVGTHSLQETEENFLRHTTVDDSVAKPQKKASENLFLHVSVPNKNAAGVNSFSCPVQTETNISITQVYLAAQKKTNLEVN